MPRSSRTIVTAIGDYDEQDDLYRSVEFAYAFIRNRVARGGKGWKGYAMWQPIETAPQDTLVMIYSPFGYDIAYLNSQTMTWFIREGQQYNFAPTCWMPLPEPPK